MVIDMAVPATVAICEHTVWFRCGRCDSLKLVFDGHMAVGQIEMGVCPDCGQVNLRPRIQKYLETTPSVVLSTNHARFVEFV